MSWAPDYCAVRELATFMAIDDEADDAVLATAISASSRAIDKACNRQFGKTDTVEIRDFTAYWSTEYSCWCVDIDDLPTITGLIVQYDTGADYLYSGTVTGYSLRPSNAIVKGHPYTQLRFSGTSAVGVGNRDAGVRVTGTFGWSSVPTPIKHATLLQASKLVTRRHAPFGIAGLGGDNPSAMRVLSSLDADAIVIVKPYYRWWGAA